MKRLLMILAIVAMGVGAIALASSLNAARQIQGFVERARVTQGVVLAPAAAGSSAILRPRVRFTTDASQTFVLVVPMEASGSTLHQGDAIRVFYDPADPGHARVEHFSALWGYPVFMGFFGALMLAIGGLLLRAGLAKARPNRPYGPDLG